MTKTQFIYYGSLKATKLVLYGTLFVSIALTALLLYHDLFSFKELRIRSIVALSIILLLFVCVLLINKGFARIVSWLLVSLYTLVAFMTMTYWGLNATAGVFTASFVIILAGILLGSKAIFPTLISLSGVLLIIQTIHSFNIVVPDLKSLNDNSTYFDVLSYITILSVFALVIWISKNQTEQALRKAKSAESLIRVQKDSIASELEKESARLRDTQLKELQQLYKFATLGQNIAATLHELSNHLSILNLDIDDLRQHHRNSQTIENAQQGIEQINQMVRQVRRQLNNYDSTKTFKIGTIIKRVISDLKDKSRNKAVRITFSLNDFGSTKIHGDPLAYIQILTVILTNSLDACADLAGAEVMIELSVSKDSLLTTVTDNGIGMSDAVQSTLFTPSLSSKPTGMGVGLYIARHLAESQLKGSIRFEDMRKKTQTGSRFIISLPLRDIQQER